MKNLKLVLAVFCIGLAGMSNAQSLKERIKAKMDKIAAKASAGKEKTYDFSDESGISGTYYLNDQIIDRQSTAGFRFTKEKDGNIVNELYVELGGKGYGNRPNSITFTLKEKYKSKFDFNYFYITDKDCPQLVNNRDKWAFTEIGKNIYSYSQNEKVLCVAAKDKAQLAEYDTETAQVLFDQKMAKANAEAMEKETKKWMENKVYAANVGKIVFANQDYHLMKRGYVNKPPMVSGDEIKTVLDMGGNMQYMAFFKLPPAKAYPGQEINIVYEMGGKTASRTELRAKSAAWNNMIKRIETKDYSYRQHSPRSLRAYNSYGGRYVQDYAFINVLHMNKDKFKVDGEYELSVKMYTSRDGENGELLAEGVIKLKYTKDGKKNFEGDPKKPEIRGVWAHFDEFLDE